MTSLICNNALLNAKDSGLDPDQITCLCKGGSCNINVKQDNRMTKQAKCTQKSDSKQQLSQNFANDLVNTIKKESSDIGDLFDDQDIKEITNIANNIQSNISTQIRSDIKSKIVNPQLVEASCNGINIGITQYSQLTTILEGLSQSTNFQQNQQQISNIVHSAISRKNKGLTGWLTGNWWIIILVVVGVVVVGVMIWYFTQKKN